MLEIRREKTTDIAAIQQLNRKAFEGDEEANIVDKIRSNCEEIISLVAIMDNKLVGHILFSPATIKTDSQLTYNGIGLAPMAVLPSYQRMGIGSRLVEKGIELLRQQSVDFIIVLGHPSYYPRFGFVPASRYGIRCQWEDVPDEAFMVLLLDKSLSHSLSGTAYYRDEFSA